MTEAEVFNAMRSYITRFPKVAAATQLARPSHVCTNACHWLRYGPVCICRQTNYLHLCTTHTCDALVESNEHLVCGLTAICYPLPYGIGYEQDANGGSNGINRNQVVGAAGSSRPLRIQVHSRRDALNKFTPSASPDNSPTPNSLAVSPVTGELTLKRSTSNDTALLAASLPAAPTINARAFSAGSVSSADSNNAGMEAEAYNLLRRLVGDRVPVNDIQYVVSRAVRLWIHITSTSVYQTLKSMYKFKYHCFIVFHHAATGLRMNEQWLILPKSSLRTHLPDVLLLQDIGLESAKHQNAIKNFNRCVQALEPWQYVAT